MPEKPETVTFWMKNTLIPLDMLFIDQRGHITKIHPNAKPLDKTPIFGGDRIFAVLEINGGLSEKLHITPDAVVQHPKIPQQDAVLPCKN